jgi:hypothetical protein
LRSIRWPALSKLQFFHLLCRSRSQVHTAGKEEEEVGHKRELERVRRHPARTGPLHQQSAGCRMQAAQFPLCCVVFPVVPSSSPLPSERRPIPRRNAAAGTMSDRRTSRRRKGSSLRDDEEDAADDGGAREADDAVGSTNTAAAAAGRALAHFSHEREPKRRRMDSSASQPILQLPSPAQRCDTDSLGVAS